MKALIIGASGQVGTAVLSVLRRGGHEAFGTYRSRNVPGLLQLDITDSRAVQERVQSLQPEVIFLPAALTNVDYCEGHPEEAHAINVLGTTGVADAARRAGAGIVYFSTDYIFDGQAGPYGEEDRPSPINIYGKTKLEAELYLRDLIPSHLIIRTGSVFGWNRDSLNFATQLYQRLSRGEPMRVAEDQWVTPTLADYLAEVCVRLAQENMNGTVHVVGRDLLPRAEFARELTKAFELDPQQVLPVTTATLAQKARRPLRGGLKTDKLRHILRQEAMPLDEALRRLRAQWRQCKPID